MALDSSSYWASLRRGRATAGPQCLDGQCFWQLKLTACPPPPPPGN
jgi:hypothetical protein